MTALLFYFVFKEKLSLKHLLGMSVIMIGVIITGYSKSIATDKDISGKETENNFYYLTIAFLYILVLCVLLSVSGIITRLAFIRGY